MSFHKPYQLHPAQEREHDKCLEHHLSRFPSRHFPSPQRLTDTNQTWLCSPDNAQEANLPTVGCGEGKDSLQCRCPMWSQVRRMRSLCSEDLNSPVAFGEGVCVFFFNIYLFIWLHRVLAAAHRIFVSAHGLPSCGSWAPECKGSVVCGVWA